MKRYGSLLLTAWLAVVAPVLAATAQLQGEDHHALLLRQDGSLWYWGVGAFANPGGGVDPTVPQRLGDGFIAAGTGFDFNVGLRADGSLWGWGSLGLRGSGVARRLLDGIRQIDVARHSVLALGLDGTVWGLGRLRRDYSESHFPSYQCSEAGDTVTLPQRLAQGMRHIRHHAGGFMAIDGEGRLWALNTYQGGTFTVVAGGPWLGFEPYQGDRIQATDSKWYRVRPDGVPYCRDSNSRPGNTWLTEAASAPVSDPYTAYGRDGVLLASYAYKQCRNLTGEPGYFGPGELQTVFQPAMANGTPPPFFLALHRDGRVIGCGAPLTGPLGYAVAINQHEPVALGGRYVAVAAGVDHSLGLDDQGVIWAWGHNNQAGLARSPGGTGRFAVGSGFIAVSAALGYRAGLKRDGSVWLWGPEMASYPERGAVLPLTRVMDDAANMIVNRVADLAVRRTDGSWWLLPYSQTADGLLRNPTWTPLPGRYVWLDRFENLAVGEEGALWTWAEDPLGVFDGRMETAPRRFEIGGGPPFARAWMVNRTLLFALGRDGRLWSATRQYGQPWGSLQWVDEGVADLASLEQTVITRKLDGSLWRWPRQDEIGQIAPLRVGNGFASLTEGMAHLLLRRDDGSLWGLGDDSEGQLGVGGEKFLYRPTELVFDTVGQVSAAVSGPLSRQRLEARLTPAVSEQGRAGHYFVAVTVPGVAGLFVFDGQGWRPDASGTPQPLNAVGPLGERRLLLAADIDLSTIAGTTLWLGYGVGNHPDQSRADMLTRGLWRAVHQLQ
ncbi:hypothetical protein [Chitinimonas lacunae]|uniref:Uncharacterized protein n=1 Tax=Chitinimonas lacunae TaxID=1963018 RepID=A0ABV8MTH5_9NEIS